MKLLRLATLCFKTNSRDARSWKMSLGDVEVRALGCNEIGEWLNVPVVAEVPLDVIPTVTPDNRVEVPEAARQQAEVDIETSANTIAVAENCRWSISSLHPFVRFLPVNAEEQAWLRERADIFIRPRFNTIQRFGIKVPYHLFGMLLDRRGGIALLAEALSHTHATGKFHELVRFFELAFGMPCHKLGDNLAQFLNPKLGYTLAEVEQWLREIRDPATHADRRPEFALQAATRPIVDRMEQAAYDVLFNKQTWHDCSVDRRRAWIPEAATGAELGKTLLITRHSTPTIGVERSSAGG